MKDSHKKEKKIFFLALAGEPVIHSETSAKVGRIVDILIEPNLLEVGAIKTSQGNWLVRPVESIPSKEVKLNVNDAVLVSGFELMDPEYQVVGGWLSICDVIHGQEVVTTGGAKLGEIRDIQIDDRGIVVAYQLDWAPRSSSSKLSQYAENERLIPVIATHALDQKVMIVNEDVLVEQAA